MPEPTDYLEIRIPWKTIREMNTVDADRIEGLIGKGLKVGWITQAMRWDEMEDKGWCTKIRLYGDLPAIRQLLPEAKSE